MEKINVAKLLKDCPRGMELDCTINNDVKFIKISPSSTYPIILRTKNGYEITLTKYGQVHNMDDSKCVIFPKGKTTWEGFVPPCQFKDGDILANDDTVFIYNDMEELSPSPSYYVYVIAEKNDLFFAINTSTKKYGTRLATEEEKNILFEAIKNNGYRWHEETKHLEKLIEPRFTVGDTIKSEKWQATRTIQTYVSGVGYFTTINDWVKLDEQDEWELVKDTTPIFKIGDKIKKKVRMIRTVDDLINTLEKCKERYPEFGKYIICVNASLPDDIIPTLKEPMLYINTDIGQVEIYTEDDE